MSASALSRTLINHAWVASCSREQSRFATALGRVAEVQTRYLLELLKHNSRTRYGAQHRFAKIRTIEEFQAQVPIVGYDALKEEMEATAHGESRVLTADPVTRFLPTSGSTSASKLIPWTAGLAREFRRGIDPWIWSLYNQEPALFRGTAYWSVSPPLAPSRIWGRVPVGFDHDSQYLGFLGQKLFSMVSTAPSAVTQCHTISEFKTQTLLALLGDENLGLISVWSPTFLSILLDDLLVRQDEIFTALEQTGERKRAQSLRSAARDGLAHLISQAWPHLRVISCWTHGASEFYAEKLRRILFEEVQIQGKGLVATEAFVSLTFHKDCDPVLAVTSHFFEFQELATGKIFLAHELAVGGIYRVIVTTGGGLYRYFIGDLVQVTGFIEEAPCFRFVGREGNVSDLFGEKLNGLFVGQLVGDIFKSEDINADFFLLAPSADSAKNIGYVLFLDAAQIPSVSNLRDLLENGLSQNFHYAHCRRLGQLRKARIFRIDHRAQLAAEIFTQEMLSRGIKLGDVKSTPLDPRPGWERRFHGEFVA